MYVLNYWHTVSDYAEWKKAFDSDPLGREASGVRRYSIERPVDGREVPILAANNAFKAIIVPAGSSEVRFVFNNS